MSWPNKPMPAVCLKAGDTAQIGGEDGPVITLVEDAKRIGNGPTYMLIDEDGRGWELGASRHVDVRELAARAVTGSRRG